MNMRAIAVVMAVCMLAVAVAHGVECGIRNPIPGSEAPDPYIVWDDATQFYYHMHSEGHMQSESWRLELYRAKRVRDILVSDHMTVYVTNAADRVFGDIWAPEMHKAPNGKWYIYTSGRKDEQPSAKRLFIMEALTDDPFGEWQFKCKPTPDVFSIDPTVYTAANGQQFICYSRVERGQVLDICALENPWTFSGKRVMISRAKYEWEMIPPYVGDGTINEGPFFVENGKRLFILYSGNGCWSNNYSLGVLEYTGGDKGDPDKMCDAANWIKHEKPILTPGNGVFGPGHASFFRSPDGTELWCAYHGMKEYNENAIPAPRYFNLQKVSFDESGYPVMGTAIGYETDLTPPSGEC